MADDDGTEPEAPTTGDDAPTPDDSSRRTDEADSSDSRPPAVRATTGDGLDDDDLDDDLDDDFGDARPPTTKAVRMAQIGLVAAAVLILIVVLLVKGGDGGSDDASKKGDKTETTTADGKKSSGKPSWPKDVEGRPPALGKTGDAPPASTEAAPGVYIWSDFDGWHLWVVNGEGVPSVGGTLTSNDDVQKAVLAASGAGTVDINDKVVTFVFPTKPAVVGMDFNPGFYANDLVIAVNGPDGPLAADQVFLGKKAVKAPFPIVLRKEVQG